MGNEIFSKMIKVILSLPTLKSNLKSVPLILSEILFVLNPCIK